MRRRRRRSRRRSHHLFQRLSKLKNRHLSLRCPLLTRRQSQRQQISPSLPRQSMAYLLIRRVSPRPQRFQQHRLWSLRLTPSLLQLPLLNLHLRKSLQRNSPRSLCLRGNLVPAMSLTHRSPLARTSLPPPILLRLLRRRVRLRVLQQSLHRRHIMPCQHTLPPPLLRHYGGPRV